MSKELEALEKLDHTLCLNNNEGYLKFGVSDVDCQSVGEMVRCLNKVESALHRLESIDTANPSEALECLEKLKGMEISSMPFSDEYGTQEVDLNDIRKVGSQLNTDFREYTTTIKNYILKTQEPKHYLKWEDLEFDDEWKYQEVKLNGTKYTIKYKCDFDFFDNYYEDVKIYNKDKRKQLFTLYNNEQFFNDLHLERVEE